MNWLRRVLGLSRHVAVLVDGENTPPLKLAQLVLRAELYGTISVKRLYGNWASPHMARWRQPALTNGFDRVECPNYVPGKNAADIALVVDAMDLLNERRVDTFCIASSDSDFIALALRIRRSGRRVVAFGKRHAAGSLMRSCDDFVPVDEVGGPKTPRPSTASTASTTSAPAARGGVRPMAVVRRGPQWWKAAAKARGHHAAVMRLPPAAEEALAQRKRRLQRKK
jgi:hypothetical protein